MDPRGIATNITFFDSLDFDVNQLEIPSVALLGVYRNRNISAKPGTYQEVGFGFGFGSSDFRGYWLLVRYLVSRIF